MNHLELSSFSDGLAERELLGRTGLLAKVLILSLVVGNQLPTLYMIKSGRNSASGAGLITDLRANDSCSPRFSQVGADLNLAVGTLKLQMLTLSILPSIGL